jgi:NADH dehydrogenase [ubiquinone] 1 alpha subcomplex assembly factor 5
MDAPFDRRLRRLRRERAALSFVGADYLHRRAADELLERMNGIKRDFREALDLGCAGGYISAELRRRGLDVTAADCGRLFSRDQANGIRCDEDRLPFADASFDLVVSVGVLDSVNDLPGALTLIRRSLKPDGLFLGAFAGAGSLPRLRSAMQAADAAATGGGSPRIHPQIDVRAAGDLLVRAGFALPVADVDSLQIRFRDLNSLVADLRAMGSTNLLTSRSRTPLTRFARAAALADFAAAGGLDGRTAERFEIIHLAGWAPSADQPQPARRGSATASLAAALRKPR